MRQTFTLLKHTPLIKFVGGPHKLAAGPPKPHPLSPTGKMPQLTGASPQSARIELKPGEVSLRLELSKRYRYKPPSASEMDQIDSGGATLVY